MAVAAALGLAGGPAMKTYAFEHKRFSVQDVTGQKVVIDKAAMQLFLWIREGPYRTAGKRFGWKGPGIGVNVEILRYCDKESLTLCIISGKKHDRYYRARLPVSDLLALTEKYGSQEKYGGVKVCVLPFTRDLFETVIDPEQVRIVLSYLEDDEEES